MIQGGGSWHMVLKGGPKDQRTRGKVRAGGFLCIDITQDRNQCVSLTSNLTPVKAECPVTVK